MTNTNDIAINKYLPLALIYFFVNSFLIPEGLLYTTLLSPLFLYFIIEQKALKTFVNLALIALLFACFHLTLGVQIGSYLKSYVLLLSVFIFCIAFYLFCQRVAVLQNVFNSILKVHLVLIPLAFIALQTGLFKTYFWYLVPISPGIPIVPRLKLFTYEASYYALLLVPIFFYYLWDYVFSKVKVKAWHLLFVCLLLALSFSLGVIFGIALTIGIIVIAHLNRFVSNKRILTFFIISFLLLLLGLILLYLYAPNNPLFARLKNIPSGKDTSARGRTYEALQLGYLIAQQKSIWLGAGLGQIKEIGRDIIMQYYQFIHGPSVARIPNAVGETLAMYGIVGLVIRFGVIVYCFFKTKVWTNYFRLSLFIFIFIYQFTGSYFFNIVEYVIWILAFSALFPEFNKSQLRNE